MADLPVLESAHSTHSRAAEGSAERSYVAGVVGKRLGECRHRDAGLFDDRGEPVGALDRAHRDRSIEFGELAGLAHEAGRVVGRPHVARQFEAARTDRAPARASRPVAPRRASPAVVRRPRDPARRTAPRRAPAAAARPRAAAPRRRRARDRPASRRPAARAPHPRRPSAARPSSRRRDGTLDAPWPVKSSAQIGPGQAATRAGTVARRAQSATVQQQQRAPRSRRRRSPCSASVTFPCRSETSISAQEAQHALAPLRAAARCG